jgi:ABC-type transport system substrate-binding protein
VLKGSSKGVGLTPSGEFNEVDVMLYDHFMPQRNFWDPPTAVSGPEGTSVRNPANFYDQEVFDLIQKQRRTLDSQERTSIIHEIQKKLSDFMWEIPWEGEADTGYTFTHPLLMNYRVWRATPDWLLNLWIDAKKLGG